MWKEKCLPICARISRLRTVGCYQPVPGATDSLLADTTDERDGCRVGPPAEPNTYDYVETTPFPVCILHDCSELEAGLVAHWLDALNDAGGGFSGYRVADALRLFLDNAQQAAELDRQMR